MNIVPHMPKGAKYTLGTRIENRFLDLLELSYTAYFIEKDKKLEQVSACILLLDRLKFLVSVAWEGKLISNNHYESVSTTLEEAGRMMYGWKNNILSQEKKNRSQ